MVRMRWVAFYILILKNLRIQIPLKADFSQKLFSNTLGSNTSIRIENFNRKLEIPGSWKFYNTHSDYEIASPVRSSTSSPDGNRVTNTRYKETDFKSGIGLQQLETGLGEPLRGTRHHRRRRRHAGTAGTATW